MAHLENGGLPEALPRGERVLWEGAPAWRNVAIRIFHVRKVALYFGALLAWQVTSKLSDGAAVAEALTATVALASLSVFAVGLLCLIAWLTSRTTLYTITDRRVVMRVGIVLTITFNLPFRTVASAGLRTWSDGSGDIPLSLAGSDRIAYLHLWPHARPWHVKRPEPMLRCVADAAQVAGILARALASSTEGPVRSVPQAEEIAPRDRSRTRVVAAAH